jgi:large subunit ribosomal protein L17
MGNLSMALLKYERIVTTLAKAKAIRSEAEKLITLGKRGDLHARRQVLKIINEKKVVKKLFNELASRFSDRNGGYTRIVKLAPRRGDGAEMAIIELVDFAERQRKAELAAEKSKTKKQGKSKAEKPAKVKTEKTAKSEKTEKTKTDKEEKAKTKKSEKETS